MPDKSGESGEAKWRVGGTAEFVVNLHIGDEVFVYSVSAESLFLDLNSHITLAPSRREESGERTMKVYVQPLSLSFKQIQELALIIENIEEHFSEFGTVDGYTMPPQKWFDIIELNKGKLPWPGN